MFSLITCTSATLVGVFFYLNDYHIVRNRIVLKWNKFRQLNKIVAINYDGFFTIIWVSFCMIFNAQWLNILRYLNNCVVQIDKKTYEVTYVIAGKTYKMIIRPLRGPRRVLLVSDENHDDVSYLVFPYLGPKENFHGEKYTPEFFKKKELVFEFSNGTERIFKEHEKIDI